MTATTDHEGLLRTMVDRLLSGEWSVPKFREQFYEYYIEELPEDALSDAAHDFFGEVQTNLDWTNEGPDPESRRYGWVDHVEYVAWVRKARRAYDAGKPIPRLLEATPFADPN